MFRWLRVLAVAALAGVSAGAGLRPLVLRSEPGSLAAAQTRGSAQPGRARWGSHEPEYDGRFTFVRLRWVSAAGGRWRGDSNAWNHDYPRAEQNLMTITGSTRTTTPRGA